MPKKSPAKKTTKKKERMDRKAIITAAIVVAASVVLAGIAMYCVPYLLQNKGVRQTGAVIPVTDVGVTWLPERQEITMSKELFTPDWNLDGEPKIEPKYYKVGVDNDKDIIIAILPGVDPTGARKIMMVQEGDTYKMIPQYSNVFYNGQYSGPAYKDNVEQAYITYHALSAPENMQVRQGVLYSVGEVYSKFFFQDHTRQEDFRQKTTTKFAETPWGELYAHNVIVREVEPADTPGFYPVLQQFILKLADGEARPYQMHPQFIGDDNVLLANWNDGTKNTNAFTWNMTNGGCGASGFVEVLDPKEITDLTAIGQTVNGEVMYGFKSLTNPTLIGHYEMLPNGTYYFYNQKTGEGEQIPISLEEYNKMHGVVVYKDSFGRYLVFVNQAYGTDAECGKPVIYLYPTTTTPVSVNVSANVRISEPDYGTGWKVVANPDGTLINADGKQYTSLFWEGLGHGQYPSVDAGFVVPQQQLKATLWSHIHKLGLNDMEAQEFMGFE